MQIILNISSIILFVSFPAANADIDIGGALTYAIALLNLYIERGNFG